MSSEGPNGGRGPIGSLRDLVALLREVAIVAVVGGALWMFWSRTDELARRLDTLGITKIGFAEREVSKLKQAVSDAEQKLESIATSPEGQADQGVVDTWRAFQTTARRVDAVLQGRGESPGAVPGPTDGGKEWGVVVGADRDLEQAKHELRRVESGGFTARLYRRQGWLRTVAVFPGEREARSRLDQLQSSIRGSAYVVDLSAWCAGPHTEADVVDCAS